MNNTVYVAVAIYGEHDDYTHRVVCASTDLGLCQAAIHAFEYPTNINTGKYGSVIINKEWQTERPTEII